MARHGFTTTTEVNGITLIHFESDSDIAHFGISVNAGSIHEEPEAAGASHFAEHMAFKGTSTRDWRQIIKEFARVGAQNNAYTSNSNIYYYATFLSCNLIPVADLICDMVFSSIFPADEIERERKVIMEEMKMYDDDPWSFFSSNIGNAIFDWDKGHNTIGTRETVSAITRDDLIRFLERKGSPDNMAVVYCGPHTVSAVADELRMMIPRLRSRGYRNLVSDGMFKNPETGRVLRITKEGLTQSQMRMITRSPGYNKSLYPAAKIALSAIGGGMFSLMFIRLREELGLCYSTGIRSFPMASPDHFVAEAYCYTSPKDVDIFQEEADRIFDSAAAGGISQEQFEFAKHDILTGLTLATETSAGIALTMMNRCLYHCPINVSSFLSTYESVTLDECRQAAEEILGGDRRWCIMDPA